MGYSFVDTLKNYGNRASDLWGQLFPSSSSSASSYTNALTNADYLRSLNFNTSQYPLTGEYTSPETASWLQQTYNPSAPSATIQSISDLLNPNNPNLNPNLSSEAVRILSEVPMFSGMNLLTPSQIQSYATSQVTPEIYAQLNPGGFNTEETVPSVFQPKIQNAVQYAASQQPTETTQNEIPTTQESYPLDLANNYLSSYYQALYNGITQDPFSQIYLGSSSPEMGYTLSTPPSELASSALSQINKGTGLTPVSLENRTPITVEDIINGKLYDPINNYIVTSLNAPVSVTPSNTVSRNLSFKDFNSISDLTKTAKEVAVPLAVSSVLGPAAGVVTGLATSSNNFNSPSDVVKTAENFVTDPLGTIGRAATDVGNTITNWMVPDLPSAEQPTLINAINQLVNQNQGITQANQELQDWNNIKSQAVQKMQEQFAMAGVGRGRRMEQVDSQGNPVTEGGQLMGNRMSTLAESLASQLDVERKRQATDALNAIAAGSDIPARVSAATSAADIMLNSLGAYGQAGNSLGAMLAAYLLSPSNAKAAEVAGGGMGGYYPTNAYNMFGSPVTLGNFDWTLGGK